MKEDQFFTVPDIWPAFACKCGKCRSCCCTGWNISISEDEYFRLVGMDCPAELRQKLDDAFYIPHDASPERYAMLNHNYLGDCPLRAGCGLCALQRIMGESAVPLICRLYPRAIDSARGEATLSNSCEAVAEAFLDHAEPLRFIPFDIGEKAEGHAGAAELAVRGRCIALMQDRRLTLRYRIACVGSYIHAPRPVRMPFEKRLSALLSLAELYGEISPSIGGYCETAMENIGDCSEEEYARLASRFEERAGNAKLVMEHMLVNHMFYTKFPYTAEAQNTNDAFAAFCGVYGLLRLLAVGNPSYITSSEKLVDVLCAAFRVIEHTRFDHNVGVILSGLGAGPEDAAGMIGL